LFPDREFEGFMQSVCGLRRVALVILLVCALLGASSEGCTKKEETAKQDKVVNVKVQKVGKQTLRPMIEAVGSLTPVEETVVAAEVDGVVKEYLVDEGDRVARGQVLVRIKDTDYLLAVDAARAALKLAEANLENALAQYGRMKALFDQQVVSKQEYDNMATRLDVARQERERAKAASDLAVQRLSKTTVTSPISGEVMHKAAAEGDFVGVGRPLVRVVDASSVKLTFSIPEKEVTRVRKGQDVAFHVEAYPARTFSARVSSILPALDDRTRMLEVQALAPNASGELRPGMFARVSLFVGDPKPTVVIPVTSVLYEGTRTRVFVAEGGKALEREVTLGAKYGEFVEVLSGVEEGETIIVVGQTAASDGVKVHVVE